jgi:hypothetical protein
VLRAVQRLADATVWPLLTGGCHTATDPVALIEAAGFTVTTVRRLRFPQSRVPQPATPHVLGLAPPARLSRLLSRRTPPRIQRGQVGRHLLACLAADNAGRRPTSGDSAR